VIETTAMGAAYLAGLGVGLWSSPDVVRDRAAIERMFVPAMDAAMRGQRYAGWQRAVERAKRWTND
jgi:glycerol kinase